MRQPPSANQRRDNAIAEKGMAERNASLRNDVQQDDESAAEGVTEESIVDVKQAESLWAERGEQDFAQLNQ